MTKVVKEKKTIKPKTSTKKVAAKQPPKKKSDFDHNDFIFKTKIKYVWDWMRYMEEELDDVNSEWLDGETYDLYAIWVRDRDFYINNNIPWTLLSARERLLMGIYRPDSKTSLDDNDKP